MQHNDEEIPENHEKIEEINENEKKLNDLRWIRVMTPMLVPRYLVEQIKDRDYSIDDFFKFQELNCLTYENGKPTLNPLNHLYVLANPDNIVKGYLWFIIDPLTKDIILNTFSIDKEYWFLGLAVKKLVAFMKENMLSLGLKRVFWINKYPKHSEKYGFKKSKYSIMQYEVDNG
jgi:hypothetical protein